MVETRHNTDEKEDIYLAQTVMTMTITIEHLYRARLPENPEVNSAGHPDTYNCLIIIKTTNVNTILLTTIEMFENTKVHRKKSAQISIGP